jgi:hypothetical protein
MTLFRTFSFLFILLISSSSFAQDWWTKTKRECIPADLTSTFLLVEKFKTEKPDEAPEQAYIDGKKGDHPWIKKTNAKLKEYNTEFRKLWKTYKHPYSLTSRRGAEDESKFGMDTAKYVLKHVLYLRKFQKDGRPDHYYTYLYYFHDRKTGKDYPYIYLFEEERFAALEKLIGYLNEL